MGEDGADKFMSQLQQAQELGSHAMKAQAIAKLIAKWAVPGSVVTGYEVLRK